MTYRITFEVEVEDEELLLEYATDRVQEAWGSDLDDLVAVDESKIGRALLEAILFSNENPSPAEYGIDFTGVTEIQEVQCSNGNTSTTSTGPGAA
jgi:hypothetical protein